MPHPFSTLESPGAAPALMLLGVAMVALAVLGSGLAELTGVALVALGAGVGLVERVSPARRFEWLLLHTAVYAALYVTFLGGRLHSGGPVPLVIADAGCSLLVLGLLARLVVRSG